MSLSTNSLPKGSAAVSPIEGSAKDLAEWLGISDRRVRELAVEGIIEKSAKGRYPLQACVVAYCAHIREVAAGRSGDEAEDLNLTKERALLIREQREGQVMKNAVTRRELLPRDEVEREWSDVLRGVRSQVLTVPSRCRALLPHLTAADVVVMDKEIRRTLTSIAEDE
jgi:phage terminase Nu1 subunit (DNA packaging protein)